MSRSVYARRFGRRFLRPVAPSHIATWSPCLCSTVCARRSCVFTQPYPQQSVKPFATPWWRASMFPRELESFYALTQSIAALYSGVKTARNSYRSAGSIQTRTAISCPTIMVGHQQTLPKLLSFMGSDPALGKILHELNCGVELPVWWVALHLRCRTQSKKFTLQVQ